MHGKQSHLGRRECLARWRQRQVRFQWRQRGAAAAELVVKAKDELLAVLAQTRLELLSPKGTLARGYSITRRKDTGQVVRRASDALPGTKISTLVVDGEFTSKVRPETNG